MSLRTTLPRLILAALCVALASCTVQPRGTTPSTSGYSHGSSYASEPQSLYQRLGGQNAVAAVIEAMVANLIADERISYYFTGVGADPARLTEQLIAQICEASGGPCQYRGRGMRAAHAGMDISQSDFNALVEGAGQSA